MSGSSGTPDRIGRWLLGLLIGISVILIVCGVGAAFHLSILWALAMKLGWHYLLVNFLAIAVVTLWNYGLNTSWTWTRVVQARAVRQPEARFV